MKGIKKNIACFNYYYYLLNMNNAYFNLSQKRLLLKMLEKTYINDEKHFIFSVNLLRLYYCV